VADDLNNTQQTGESRPETEPMIAPESPTPVPENVSPLEAEVPVAQDESCEAAPIVLSAGEADSSGEPVAEPVSLAPVSSVQREDSAAEAAEGAEVADGGDAETESLKPVAPAPKPSGKRGRSKEKQPVEPEPVGPKSENMSWYILKVQSNREDSIREGLQRRVKIAGLDFFFGDVIVPTEMVTEFKGGKKRVVKRKLYPGYLVVQMEINEDSWFLVRETPGIGDFTGAAGHPTPMLPHEVSKIVARQEEKSEEAPKLKINFNTGDRVKINEGTFENFEGEVDAIDQTNGRVTVMINIFGRSTPVELEYWQIEAI